MPPLNRRELKIYRRDSSDAAIAASGTAADTPTRVAATGYDSIVIFARVPAGGGAISIAINQYLRSNATAVATSTLAVAAGGFTSQAIDRTGELVGVTITETGGALTVTPEVLVSLVKT